MRWKMPVGIEDFRELRQGPYYFVDKTEFIRRLLDDHSKVTLFTRPRRFGKTLTMSMLEWFFSLEKADESGSLFDGLAISGESAYMQQRGQYPVLFVSLKDIRDDTWEMMQETFRSTISTWCLHYDYLCHSKKVQTGLKARLQALEMQQGNQGEMGLALYLLLMAMQQHYGRPVILLIDEYDAPIQQAWQQGFYEQAISFMRRFLGSALKSNPYLDFAVLTGVMRISKESIFSGLNNLDVYTVMSRRYDDVFGFTEAEVQVMVQELGETEVLPVLKQWYDGYHFGSQEIYNPWLVINFFHHGEAGDYWVNTSENTILKLLLAEADGRQARNLQGLLEGKGLAVTLHEQVIYSQLRQDSSALYTLLLTTGYLTAASSLPVRRNRYLLQIPNQEIRDIYSSEILNNLTRDTDENAFDDLFDYLFNGKSEDFAYQLQKILQQVVSTYDTANKESFYHGFMLGMTALFLGKDYYVESNRESGYGRFDLAIFPQESGKAGVIMEFKVAEKEADLPGKAAEALQQIEEKGYLTAFRQRKIMEVWKYGIAFCGKKIAVRR